MESGEYQLDPQTKCAVQKLWNSVFNRPDPKACPLAYDPWQNQPEWDPKHLATLQELFQAFLGNKWHGISVQILKPAFPLSGSPLILLSTKIPFDHNGAITQIISDMYTTTRALLGIKAARSLRCWSRLFFTQEKSYLLSFELLL